MISGNNCTPTQDQRHERRLFAPDIDEAILLQFQQEHEQAADPEAVLADYCTRHPHLAARLRRRAAMARLLTASSPEPPEPLPARLGEFRVLSQSRTAAWARSTWRNTTGLAARWP